MSTNSDIITQKTLAKAGNLEIYDENEKKIKFSTLFATERTMVIFIRHFLCGNCMEYVCRLSAQITLSELATKNTHIVIIGCGSPSLIKNYRSETQSVYPIYSDPSQALFKQFGLMRTLSLGKKKPEYMSFGVIGGIVKGVGLGLKAGMGAFKSGDMKQVGGEFLLGPGEVCEWGHRMTNTRDHAEIEELRRVLKLDDNKDGKQELVNGNEDANGKAVAVASEMSKQEVNNAVDTTPTQVSVH